MTNKELKVTITLDDKASAGLNNVINKTEQTNKSLKDMANTAGGVVNKSLNSFTEGLKKSGVAIAALTAGIGFVAKDFIKIGSDFQQARISFETMLGSGEKAGKLLAELSDFAKTTPFDLPQVVDGTKRLLAYNIAAEDIIPTFSMLGDIAAGVGTDKLPELILAFGQVRAATRLTGMELRQFSEAGVPLLSLLAKQLGKTEAQIQEMVTDKNISFQNVVDALKATTSEGGKFFKLMANQSKTVGGRLSNLRDNIVRLKLAFLGIKETGEIEKGGIFDILSTSLERLLEALDRNMPKIQEFFLMLTKNSTFLKATMGVFIGLAVLAIAAFVAAISSAIPLIAGFAAAGALIAVAWQPLMNFFAMLKDKIINEVIPAIIGIKDGFVAFFAGVVSQIMTFGQGIIEGVGGIFTEIQNRINGTLSMSMEDWAYFFGYLLGSLETQGVAFSETWGYFWDGIGLELTERFVDMYTKFELFMMKMEEGMTEKEIKIQSDWKYFWIGLGTILVENAMAMTESITYFLNNIPTLINDAKKSVVDAWNNFWQTLKNIAMSFIGGISSAIDGMLDKLRSLKSSFESGYKSGKNKGYAHGGTIPGAYNQPVPIIAHGGERIIPKNGVDVGGNNSNGNITINFNGSIGIRSDSDIEAIAQAVKRMINREDVLFSQGVY